MRSKKNSIITNALLILIYIVLAVTYIISSEPNIVFLANVITMIFTIIISKISFFSIKSIVLNYLLFSCYFQYNIGESYGILEISSLPLNYLQINYIILIYNVLCYIWLASTNILKKEEEFLISKNLISLKSAYFCSIIAIVCAIIAFPGIPFSREYISNRFIALLPGTAWNHLSIVATLFAIGKLKDSKFVKFSVVFVIFWFLSHFERVDIIGLTVLLFILLVITKKLEIKPIKLMKYGVVALVIFIVMIYIGDMRNNVTEFKISDISKKVLVQSTAADIGHVFNVATNYYNNESLLLGETYVTYIVEIIPFLSSNHEISTVIYNYYPTPGGSYILSEPLINFGIIGVVIFQTFEFFIYKLILSKNSQYRRYVYFFLIISVFRTTWYGLLYIEKAMIYFIPIMYFICNFIDRKEKITSYKKEENEKMIEGAN
ncbi:MAG: hypothetical protein N2749_03355 [Clostridia bacterium]|nr:hypothetical protein [Clostridia bacterium]